MNAARFEELRETVHRFGASSQLVGVLTVLGRADPDGVASAMAGASVDSTASSTCASTSAANASSAGTSALAATAPRMSSGTAPDGAKRVGVLLWNAGVVPRMGPHRFNVKLARHLAHQGHPVMRFDLSGQGDSDASDGQLVWVEQTNRDIIDAVDTMQREAGIDTVLIVGICSGANQGWRAALQDARIGGLVMIDPYAYATSKTLPMYHWRRLRHRTMSEILTMSRQQVGSWLARFVPGGLGSMALRDRERAAAVDAPDSLSLQLPQPAYAAGMQQLVERDVKLLLVFTGTWGRYYSYAGQFAEVFGRYPFAARIDLDFVPQFDHTFTLVGAQQKMIRRIASWTGEKMLPNPSASRVVVPAGAGMSAMMRSTTEAH